MPSNGIMQEIRSYLAQHKSSAEIIALGFKPSSVYKAQGQLRRLNTKVDLPQQLKTPGEQATAHVSIREELAHTLDRISDLETKAGAADVWKQKYQDMERRLHENAEEMGRKAQEWQEGLVAEQKAQNRTEALAAQHSAEVARLQEENQELQQRLDSLPEHLAQEVWKLVQPLNAELEELRPLKIWADHSCTPSDKPALDHLMCHPLAQ